MKKRPALETNDAGFLTLLSVSPFEADHSSLHAIADSTRWVLLKAHDVVSALASVERQNIGVVVCERDCMPGMWTGMLDRLSACHQFQLSSSRPGWRTSASGLMLWNQGLGTSWRSRLTAMKSSAA